MAISEREHHIKTLENLLKETKGKIELYSENKNIDLTKEKEIEETLAYAISSLKTDFKYDLMYEGEEIYTKANMVAMLTELQTEIEGQCKIPNNNLRAYDWNNGVYACYKAVQEKIDKLKGEQDG